MLLLRSESALCPFAVASVLLFMKENIGRRILVGDDDCWIGEDGTFAIGEGVFVLGENGFLGVRDGPLCDSGDVGGVDRSV